MRVHREFQNVPPLRLICECKCNHHMMSTQKIVPQPSKSFRVIFRSDIQRTSSPAVSRSRNPYSSTSLFALVADVHLTRLPDSDRIPRSDFRFHFDSTVVRRPFDYLSEVIKATVTQPASRSHADLFVYLGRRAAAR